MAGMYESDACGTSLILRIDIIYLVQCVTNDVN